MKLIYKDLDFKTNHFRIVINGTQSGAVVSQETIITEEQFTDYFLPYYLHLRLLLGNSQGNTPTGGVDSIAWCTYASYLQFSSLVNVPVCEIITSVDIYFQSSILNKENIVEMTFTTVEENLAAIDMNAVRGLRFNTNDLLSFNKWDNLAKKNVGDQGGAIYV